MLMMPISLERLRGGMLLTFNNYSGFQLVSGAKRCGRLLRSNLKLPQSSLFFFFTKWLDGLDLFHSSFLFLQYFDTVGWVF